MRAHRLAFFSFALVLAACAGRGSDMGHPDSGTHDMGVVTTCSMDSMCNDSLSCTIDHCGSSLMCTHTDTCASGMHCTSTGCAAGGSCTMDSECSDSIDCTLDSCGASHTCNHDPVDSRCADAGSGFTCVVGTGCMRTGCATDADCNDSVDCTLDSCSSAHMCVHDLVDSRCADAGAGARCSLSGCSVLPATCTSDADCADGNFCNGDEICMGMELGCAPATTPRSCDDTNMCTVDMCDPTMPTDVPDGGRPSTGKCTHVCTATPSGCPTCPTGMPDYNGHFSLAPTVHQSCSAAAGDSFVTLSSVTFTYTPPAALTVMAGMLSLSQVPAPTGGSFDVTVVIAGGCEEHYELMGMFTDADHFSATFTADFVDTSGTGFGCGFSPCMGYSTMVTGTRIP